MIKNKSKLRQLIKFRQNLIHEAIAKSLDGAMINDEFYKQVYKGIENKLRKSHLELSSNSQIYLPKETEK